MAEEKVHIVTGIILAAITLPFGAGPAYAVFFGALFPDIDVLFKGWHRSWITHTAFVPALLSYSTAFFPSLDWLSALLPFFAFGIVVHVILDFWDYEKFKGTRIPFNPKLSDKWPEWPTLITVLIPQIPFLFYGMI